MICLTVPSISYMELCCFLEVYIYAEMSRNSARILEFCTKTCRLIAQSFGDIFDFE